MLFEPLDEDIFYFSAFLLSLCRVILEQGTD